MQSAIGPGTTRGSAANGPVCGAVPPPERAEQGGDCQDARTCEWKGVRATRAYRWAWGKACERACVYVGVGVRRREALRRVCITGIRAYGRA